VLGEGGGVGEAVVDQYAERGETDHLAEVDEQQQDRYDDLEDVFGAIGNAEPGMDGPSQDGPDPENSSLKPQAAPPRTGRAVLGGAGLERRRPFRLTRSLRVGQL
jgi:hypothetical protein